MKVRASFHPGKNPRTKAAAQFRKMIPVKMMIQQRQFRHSHVDAHCMHKRTYSAMEEFLGYTMKQQLITTMTEAAQVERLHAITTNSYHQMFVQPAISVVVDCCATDGPNIATSIRIMQRQWSCRKFCLVLFRIRIQCASFT